MAGPQCRYVFTYNNYTEEGERNLKEYLQEKCKYAIFGHEVAPTTGTPHLQGFMNLKKKARMVNIQKDLKALNVAIALKEAKGNDAQNQTYCSKEGMDIFEVGTPVSKGQRTDLITVAKQLKKRPLAEVIEEHPDVFVKYTKGLIALKDHYDQQEFGDTNRAVHVTLLYGDAGTGKTRDAQTLGDMYGRTYVLSPPNGGSLWWDGYDGQETVIIDDFYGWMKPHDLFRVLDIYPLRLQLKGHTRVAKFTRVYITSNQDSTSWYKEAVQFDRDALERRIHKRVLYSKDLDGKTIPVVLKDEPVIELQDHPNPERLELLKPKVVNKE